MISQLPGGRYVPLVSVSLVLEYEEVLGRTGKLAPLTKSDVDDFLDYFLSQAMSCRIDFLWRPFLKDPDDDALLELAVAGGASTIVTHNLRDFVGVEQFGVRAVSPATIIKELKL